MIEIRHSPTGKGSVIFHDEKPIILIRGGNWTLRDSKIDVIAPEGELRKDLVRIAIACKPHEVEPAIIKLGVDYPFMYRVSCFLDTSVKQAELDMMEI